MDYNNENSKDKIRSQYEKDGFRVALKAMVEAIKREKYKNNDELTIAWKASIEAIKEKFKN
jgi:hypothetical protein